MRKMLGRIVLLGALAGGAVAVRNYMQREAGESGSVEIVFDDGSAQVLAPNTAGAREFTEIARKVVEIGL